MPIEYKTLLGFQTAKSLNWMIKVRLGSFPFLITFAQCPALVSYLDYDHLMP